jgi:hypothetical protein
MNEHRYFMRCPLWSTSHAVRANVSGRERRNPQGLELGSKLSFHTREDKAILKAASHRHARSQLAPLGSVFFPVSFGLLPVRQRRYDELPRAGLWRFGLGFSRLSSHRFFSLIFYEKLLGPITASFMAYFCWNKCDNSSKTTDLSHIVLAAMAAGA